MAEFIGQLLICVKYIINASPRLYLGLTIIKYSINVSFRLFPEQTTIGYNIVAQVICII